MRNSFLTDYLEGDHSFKVHREGHNLDRCRTQFKLVSDMESHWDEMKAIVKKTFLKILKARRPRGAPPFLLSESGFP